MRKPRPKVLLDTNVWRGLADAVAGDMLRRVARRASVQMQIAPAVVYEALRTPNAEVRDKQTALMTNPEWTRLMPEAYSESMEVLGEIRRVRQEWLWDPPDLQPFRQLKHDWKRSRGGFWDRARLDTAREAGRVRLLGDRDLALARADAEYLRSRALEAGWQFDSVDLAKVTQRPSVPAQGWDGDELEPWRWDALDAFTHALQSPGHPYAEWLSPHVDLTAARASRESWTRFWLYDVMALNLRRSWVRWGIKLLQALRRVTPGTPGDNQLSTYLVECDYFVAADRTLVDIARKCRGSAPFGMAVAVLVSGGTRSVSDVAQALDGIGSGRVGGGPQ